MAGLQAEIDEINRACARRAEAEEAKMMAEVMAASLAAENARVANERAIAEALVASRAADAARQAEARMVTLHAHQADDLAEALAASIHSERLREREEKELASAMAESTEMLAHMMISGRASDVFNALVPGCGEIKLMCPWCRQPQVMEINCGIAHCGARYVGGVLTQLPPHGPVDAYAGRPFVIGGCGRQYKYIRATGAIERCAGQ